MLKLVSSDEEVVVLLISRSILRVRILEKQRKDFVFFVFVVARDNEVVKVRR